MTNLIKQHSAKVLKNQEVKNTSEQLKESLNCAKIITPCHLDTRNV